METTPHSHLCLRCRPYGACVLWYSRRYKHVAPPELKALARMLHRAGLSLHIDCVINHNGLSNLGTPGYLAAGGYPGIAITIPNDIDGDTVHITYTLTTMGCPIGPMIEAEIKQFLSGVEGIENVDAEMVLRPPWTPEMMSDEAKAALGFF